MGDTRLKRFRILIVDDEERILRFLTSKLKASLGLASLGLQTTSPQSVALPLKLVLFVAVDGWRLLLESLLKGYA